MRKLLIVSATLAAVTASPVLADEIACPEKITPEVVTALGEPVGWLAAGQTVHTPAGLTIVGQPVSYVLEVQTSADTAAPVTELDYRLQGLTRPYGQRYTADLRKAFDKGFSGSNCGTAQNTSCVVDYKAGAVGELTGAELSEGSIAMPKDARGSLVPVKADYNLDGADPVFLICHYKGS